MTTAPVEVSVDGGRIIVRAPYAYTHMLRAIPGARWDPGVRAWTYPESSAVAHAVARVLAGDPTMTGGRKWESLLAQADAEQQAGAARDADDLPEIPGLAGTSWLHQRQAYHFAAGRVGSMLALKMGAGKSRVAVGLMRNMQARGQAGQALVICPLSVVPVWPREIAKHAPDWRPRVVALDSGTVADKRGHVAHTLERDDNTARVVIVNYDSARLAPLAAYLLSKTWDLVVLDESHKIKAPGGSTSMFVSRLRDKARRRVCLTGTPMPHSPLDVYAQYRFLDPGIYGTSFVRFKSRYAITVNVGFPKIVDWRDMDDLNARFYSAAVRFDGDLGLPEATHVERVTRLEAAAARTYRDLEDLLYAEVEEGTVTAANALVKLLRLAQLSGGVLKLDQEDKPTRVSAAKPDLLRDVLEDMGAEPVVVVCRFQADLDAVHEAAGVLKLRSAEVSGRRRELAAWQAHGGPEVLALQIQAGGVGVDLTRARYMVLYSVGYSLGDYDQVLARVHRPGQTRDVTYVHLTVEGTVDEQIRKALEERADLVEAALRRRDR